MKHSEYFPHLGFFRHFALCRSLYDRIGALEDQLRAKDASHALKVRAMQDTIDKQMDRIAVKFGSQPIHHPSPVRTEQPKPVTGGPDVLAFRQQQVDTASKIAAQQQERENEAARRAEFADIVNSGAAK